MSVLDELEGKQEQRIDPDANPLLSERDEDFTDALIEGVCKEQPGDQSTKNSQDGKLNTGSIEEDGKKVRTRRRRRGIY